MLELKKFQADAAKLIADRYAYFASHPYRPKKGPKPRPFFQGLSALTGAGKTPILAQAVALMRAHFGSEPIVFWISKAKSVVGQTYANFSAGGKYSEIVDGFRVINVSQLTPSLISDGSSPLLLLATTGLFNNKEQAAGSLNIYKKDEDQFGELSPWERLIERKAGKNRRPLLVVYDEGHNLSEQQTEILGELEPDAYLLASATPKLTENFSKSVLRHIKTWLDDIEDDELPAFETLHGLDEKGKPDLNAFITTAVDSEQVVDAELVKCAIQFDGTTATMERCLDELSERLVSIEGEIKAKGLSIKPKAIYVCKTNIADDGERDDPSKPFEHRKAPPIRIWRYLVEDKGVDPKSIAIYANLAFADKSKPEQVNLFSKGENDFDDFTAGDYQHIIFNLALQEGWDDPACYLAYIDKSMGSSIQVEQIIGRALRQPGARHYESPILNSAHFFLRVDSKSVFTDAIKTVKAKLQAEGAAIEVVENFSANGSASIELKPREGVSAPLFHVNVNAEAACERIAEIVGEFPTFAEGSIDTVGLAHAASKILDLKKLAAEEPEPSWIQEGNTNPVRLRWLASLALRARSTRALAVTDFKDQKFDVRVQVQSNANKAAEKIASEIVQAYYQHSDLVYETLHPFAFGPIRVPKGARSFENSLYERYSSLNKFELACAESLDKVGNTWHRNPSSGGFHIPLLSEGDTASFYPDFLVWKGSLVYCVDTKGGHLLSDAVARKLFDIHEGGKTRLLVRFITEGKQSELRGKALKGGYTVWKMKSGAPTPIHVADLDAAVKECLK